MPARLEFRDADGRGLCVEFLRVQDRYAHVISRLDGERAVPVWESVEGTDADDWPSSPPLQQLSLETLSDGRHVALAVGMAGTSHWSLSVEGATDEPAFIFDVACRVKQTPLSLGSVYRQLKDGCELNEPPKSNDFRHGIEIKSDLADCEVRTALDESSIVPRCISGTLPSTMRWKYRIVMK